MDSGATEELKVLREATWNSILRLSELWMVNFCLLVRSTSEARNHLQTVSQSADASQNV